jgi:hypothetical protein
MTEPTLSTPPISRFPRTVLTYEEWANSPDLRALQTLRSGLTNQAEGLIGQVEAIERQIAAVDIAIRTLREGAGR